jgi:site-specific DNA recombinase
MRIALYARVSTASEEQENALAQQLDRLRAAAAGHETVEFIDVDSGSKHDRPELDKLLAACYAGQVDRVICTRLDRMSRSMAHGAELLTYFSAPDTPSLWALDDSLDLATVSGRMCALMIIAWAQAEVERLRERVSHGCAYRRKRHMPLGPKAPFGYRFNKDRSNYELDPATADVARGLIAEFIEHGELRTILRQVQDRDPCPWTSAAGLRGWLLNPTIAGYRVYGHDQIYRDSKGKPRKRRMRPGEYQTMVPNAHPALVDEAEFAKIRAKCQEHCNRQRSGLLRGYVRELTMLVKCSHCGHFMAYQKHVRLGWAYLRCTYFPCESKRRNRINVQTVKEAIWAKLKENRDELLACAMVSMGRDSGQLEVAEKLRRQIKSLEDLNDPMPQIQEAIEKKRQLLRRELQSFARRDDHAIASHELRQALMDEEFWLMVRNDPTMTRRIFVEHVEELLVRNREVEAVVLRREQVVPSA